MSRLAIVLLLCASARAIEVTPTAPKEYDLIVVTHDSGGFVEVQSVRKGELYFPPVLEISDTKIVWTGPPGVYWITGRDRESRIRQRIVISQDESPDPDPEPDPEPKPEPDPEPEPIVDTTYDVGPQMRAIVPESARRGVAGVFMLAAKTAINRGGPIQDYATQISKKIQPLLPDEQHKKYGELFSERNREGKIVSTNQHVEAWLEVHTWLIR